MSALTVIEPKSNAEIFRESTDAAGLCREIVKKTAMKIQGREYVRVEGWQAIAIAHGCIASSYGTERVDPDNGEVGGGYKAFGRITRMNDGAVLAEGVEGFVGDDEKMWAGRPVYARRAMAQTRAISRVCRSAFAHIVVLIDANMSTTPAEEVPDGGFHDEPMRDITPPKSAKAAANRAASDAASSASGAGTATGGGSNGSGGTTATTSIEGFHVAETEATLIERWAIATGLPELQGAWRANKEKLELLKRADPASYARVEGKKDERKMELSAEGVA